MMMFTLLILSATRIQAQKTEQLPMYKVEAGFRFTTIIADFKMQTAQGNKVSEQAIPGYGAGSFMGYNISKHLGVQIEINYSSVSRKFTETGITRTVSLQYIDIPLLLSFNTNKLRRVNFNIVAGPQLGVNTGSNIHSSGEAEMISSQPQLSVRTTNMGLAYGAGIDFGLNHKHTFRLAMGYRGMLGLYHINNNKATLNSGSYYIMQHTPLHTYSVYLGLSIII